MKHVPKYLIPRIVAVPTASADGSTTLIDAPTSLGAVEAGSKDVGFVPFRKPGNYSKRGGAKGGRGGRGGRGGGRGRKSDPLRKFGK